MYQAHTSLKEIIVNPPRNYFFLNIMQHLKTKNLRRIISYSLPGGSESGSAPRRVSAPFSARLCP